MEDALVIPFARDQICECLPDLCVSKVSILILQSIKNLLKDSYSLRRIIGSEKCLNGGLLNWVGLLIIHYVIFVGNDEMHLRE